MNWRKPLIKALLKITGSKIINNLNEIKRIENFNKEQIKEYQDEKLKKILLHAYKNVPYYTKVLVKSKVIVNGEVHLENFNKIPILTKDIMRKEGNNLYSKDYQTRKPFENTSGGSTGEPVRFIQDKNFYEWMVATKLYYFHMAGKELGEKELKLWGSERDILEGTIGIKDKLMNFLYNRRFLNSFRMTQENMKEYLEEINRFKPIVIWAYVDSIFELAKYIEENNLKVYSPRAIISAAGNLTNDIRAEIERVFGCKVFNAYGTREVGDIASEKEPKKGLIIYDWFQYLEVIKSKIIITNLENYSMPFIRYEIGDLGELGENDNNFNILKSISGREMEVFKNSRGDILTPEYFIHMIGVVFNDGSIRKFQIIQNKIDKITIKAILNKSKGDFNKTMKTIEEKVIKSLMGNNCKIEWEIVKDIPKTKSGKYLYTISEIR